MKKIVKQSVFILQENTIYVSPPTSWGFGLAKLKWFEKIINKTPKIASSEKWEDLKSTKRVMRLVEYDDNSWESFNEQENS